jgi:putative PIN family toxin of toxin-antitoxin system
MLRVVLDTNVIVSALRSSRGASFALLEHLEQGDFQVAVSVPLVLEYEDVLLRKPVAAALSAADVRDFLDGLCTIAHRQPIFFLWRPLLSDPKDDMIAEVAVAAECAAIVTHNIRDFAGLHTSNVKVLTPAQMLQRLRGVK